MKHIVAFLFLVALAAGLAAQQPPAAEELLRGYGSLDESDARGPGGRVEDRYSVFAPEEGFITVTVVSPDFQPGVEVDSGRTAQEERGNRNAASMSIAVRAGEEVRIAVFAVDARKTYADYLVVARYADGGGPTVGGTIRGTLEEGDETDGSGAFVDRYDIRITEGELIRVDLSSYDFDTYLRVELPDGRRLENDDSSGTDSSLTFSARATGTAFVEVSSFGYGSTGDYTLEISTVEETTIRVGQSLRGELESDDDVYILTGDPGETVTIELESNDFDTYLELTDPSGVYLSNDDADGITLSRLVYEMGVDGEATVTVSSFGGGRGDYSLSVERYAYDGPRIPDGYRLSDGETITGSLGPHLPLLDGSYRQMFTVDAEKGERLELVLRSDDFDSYLIVVTPRGEEITDDDSAGGLDSRVVLTAEQSGIYEIYASDLGGGSIGSYSLTFTRRSSARLLLDTRGELTRDDRTDITGKYYDTYRFTVSSGRFVTVDVVSDEFDGYAIVRSASGEVLYRDDDSGGDSNPRIVFTAERSETLELVVTTYSAEVTGDYSVSIYE